MANGEAKRETALEKCQRYRNGEFRLVEAVESCLAAIDAHGSLNAFIQLYAEEARQRAAEIDAAHARRKPPGNPRLPDAG